MIPNGLVIDLIEDRKFVKKMALYFVEICANIPVYSGVINFAKC